MKFGAQSRKRFFIFWSLAMIGLLSVPVGSALHATSHLLHPDEIHTHADFHTHEAGEVHEHGSRNYSETDRHDAESVSHCEEQSAHHHVVWVGAPALVPSLFSADFSASLIQSFSIVLAFGQIPLDESSSLARTDHGLDPPVPNSSSPFLASHTNKAPPAA